MMLENNISQIAKNIRLLILDVDGVLTNGKIYVTAEGAEIIQFHVHDGFGMRRLMQSGVELAVISSRNTKAVVSRLEYLGVKHVFLGQTEKLDAYEILLKKLNLTASQVAYMGDDLPDEPVMKKVALPITVPQAADEIKKIALWQTQRKGGKGAVREVCDFIYHATLS